MSDDDFYDYEPMPGRWSSVGPGNAGEECCECGYYLSWPKDTTDEDKAVMLRLWGKHEASCPDCQPTTPTKETPMQTSMPAAGRMILALSDLGKHVYGGTVPAHVKAKRRARNKAARASRPDQPLTP